MTAHCGYQALSACSHKHARYEQHKDKDSHPHTHTFHLHACIVYKLYISLSLSVSLCFWQSLNEFIIHFSHIWRHTVHVETCRTSYLTLFEGYNTWSLHNSTLMFGLSYTTQHTPIYRSLIHKCSLSRQILLIAAFYCFVLCVCVKIFLKWNTSLLVFGAFLFFFFFYSLLSRQFVMILCWT